MMIRVQDTPFDPGIELNRFMADAGLGAGGIASFVGNVRDRNNDVTVRALTLEHYPGMTEKMLGEIEAVAVSRWHLGSSLIIHRAGRLVPGEPIVLVATASAHREAAFEACHFLMDWLKTKAPFWKLEETEHGERWIEARDTDTRAADRWNRT